MILRRFWNLSFLIGIAHVRTGNLLEASQIEWLVDSIPFVYAMRTSNLGIICDFTCSTASAMLQNIFLCLVQASPDIGY
jgi:hypothetical protein